jgi:hypothetical protein
MLDVLRRDGRYARFAQRAARKTSRFGNGARPEARELSGLQALQLIDWYFARRLGEDMPDDVEAFWQCLGYRARNDFLDVLLQEYAYLNSEACLETS